MVSELRHGNYYYFSGNSEGLFDYENNLGRVLLNDYYQFYVELTTWSNEMLDYFTPEQIKPIPITLEWLQFLGFYGSNHNRRFLTIINSNNDVTIYFQQDILTIEDSGDFVHNLLHIQYIHQLQNFYFGLTGKELIYERTT